MARHTRAVDAGMALALLAGNLLVVTPYLLTEFCSHTWSNDYQYVANARMFRDQPWTWNALQHCGAPFSYMYPPLFHVLVVALPVSLGRAFHLLSGLSYAFVPVSLYFLAVQLFRSRIAATFAAVADSVLPSPVYLLPLWRNLASGFHHAPWSFVTLVEYSEAPHTLALALTLLTAAAAWRNQWKIASFCAAAVLLLNWPGVIGLGIALASVAVARIRDLGYRGATTRLFATVGVAYGISAFWITPGFLLATTLLDRVMLRHTEPGAPWGTETWTVLVATTVLLGVALWKRTPSSVSFVLTWIALSGAVVVTFGLAGSRLLPLPNRYVLEFNVGLLLALASFASTGSKWRVARVAVVACAAIAGAWAAQRFLRDPWKLQPGDANQQETLAFQIADWLKHNGHSSRVLTAGELDGSLNAFGDVTEASGIGQGISNWLVAAAKREVAQGCADAAHAARIDELWLRALDARYVVVHDANSHEHFHLFVRPEAFAGLPVAWTNGAGDTIYHLPPPEQHQAVVVDLAALQRLPPLHSTDDLQFLEAYVHWAEGKRPAEIHWARPDSAELQATLASNEGILVKVNHDRGWRATGGTVQPDPIGFLLIRPEAGHQPFHLQFGASWEVWLARGATLLTIALLVADIPLDVVALFAVIPCMLAYGALSAAVPPQVAVAEDSFRRIQPPRINAGGILDSMARQQSWPSVARPIEIYGENFGSKDDRVHVWIGDRQARILYHGSNQLNVELPDHTDAGAQVAVEVKGCRGNSFSIGKPD